MADQLTFFSSMEEEAYNTIVDIVESAAMPSEYLHCEPRKDFLSVLVGKVLMCRISLRGNKNFISLKYKSNNIVNASASPLFSRIEGSYFVNHKFQKPSDLKNIAIYIVEAFKICYLASGVNKYDCCDLVEACSDALQCLRADKKRALSCTYKAKLEKGIIFYGKNRNVD